MKLRILTISVVTAMLSGCAGMMHNKNVDEFSGSMHVADYQKASEFAVKKSGWDEQTNTVDDLLWAIEAGAALNYAGNYKFSTRVLDASEKTMKEEDQESVAEEGAELALSMLGNDAMMAYEQRHADGVMANTIKAWNFMFTGDSSNARVEWNRAEERQRRAVEHFESLIKEQKEELAKESAGEGEEEQDTSEMVNKTLDNDETSERLAAHGVTLDQWKPYDGFVNPYTTYSYALNLLLNGQDGSDYQQAADAFKRVYGMTESKQVKNDIELAKAMASDKRAADNMVWVIYENGESMVKEEFRIDLPLFLFTDDVAYTGIALPKLKEREAAYPSISVNGVETEVIADMDKIIGAEFEKEFPMILTREISRTILKTVAQKQLDDADPYIGLAASILQVATTNADTRSFTSLPKNFQTAHFKRTGDTVNVKAGIHEVPVKLDENATKHIIYVKAPSAAVAPSVRVINI